MLMCGYLFLRNKEEQFVGGLRTWTGRSQGLGEVKGGMAHRQRGEVKRLDVIIALMFYVSLLNYIDWFWGAGMARSLICSL